MIIVESILNQVVNDGAMLPLESFTYSHFPESLTLAVGKYSR